MLLNEGAMLTPACTVLFLVAYHFGLFYLGCFFFDNLIFKDFEKDVNLVKIIFCSSFVLCTSLLSMLLFEILGFMSHGLKLITWFIDISLLNLFVYIIIPGSIIFTYITYEDETFSKGLYKFKYFYSLLNILQKQKLKTKAGCANNIPNNSNHNHNNRNNSNSNSNNINYIGNNVHMDSRKEQFWEKLMYVNDGIKNEMKSFNRKLQLRNRKKLGKLILVCCIFLPLLWFIFYKFSSMSINNTEDGIFVNENFSNLKHFVGERYADHYNDEVQSEYNQFYDYINGLIFVRIIQQLLTYISISGMTIASALSAFTSIYSPYKQLHNFFFFVTIKKVKIIEKKIDLLAHQLFAKKKILLLYKNAHLLENCARIKEHLLRSGKSCEDAFENIDLEDFIATSSGNFTSCTQQYDHIYIKEIHGSNSIRNRCIEREKESLGDDLAYMNKKYLANQCSHYIPGNQHKRHDQHIFYEYNPIDMCESIRTSTALEMIDSGKYIGSSSNIAKEDNKVSNIKPEENYSDWHHSLSKLKKCNLYLDNSDSTYAGIIDTFLAEKKPHRTLILNSSQDINEMEETSAAVIRNEEEMHDTNRIIELSRDKLDSNELDQRKHIIAITKNDEEKYKNSEYFLCKRNVHSKNEFEDMTMSKRFLLFFKTKKNTINSCGLIEEEETRKSDTSRGYDTDNYVNNYNSSHYNGQGDYSFMLRVKQEGVGETVKSVTSFLFKRNSETENILPHNISENKNRESICRSLHKTISCFIAKHAYASYNALKGIKNSFRRQKESIYTKKKEILVQDIKALEYLLMKFFFLLDEVIKEQIRIKESTTFVGICLYILNCIMFLLCFYKIIRNCYIMYMIEIYYRFIATYTDGHVLLLYYTKHINISLINEVENLLNAVRVRVNLNDYVTAITSVLLLVFIFLNLLTFMERIIKLKYSAKTFLYSNLAILAMCEIMNLYFAAYCIILFSFLPFKQKTNLLYIFFNNNVLNLCKLLYHSDVVFVCTLIPSLILVRHMHKNRAKHFMEV